MIRAFVCGAHSVGKTTLVNAVAEELDIQKEAEVARKVIAHMNLRREDFDPSVNPEKFEELQKKILEAQCAVEKRNSLEGKSYIADRGIDPLVYSLLYLGEASMRKLLELPPARECIQRYKSSLIFVVKPFPECIKEDSVRLVPKMDELLDFTEKMEQLLQQNDIAYTIIDVLDINRRVEIVKEKILEYQTSLKFKSRNEKDIYNVRDD